MAKLKKVLEIVALPLVLIVGHAMTTMILLLVAMAVAAYLGWLIVLNLEGSSGVVVLLDAATVVGLVLILRSKRFRMGLAEIWKQLSRNL